MKYSAKWAVALSVTAAAVLVACGGGGGLDVQDTSNQAPPASITATIDASTTVVNSPIAALDKEAIVFTGGVSEFGTTLDTTITIDTAAATPTFTVSDSEDEATGEFSLGSCKFKITQIKRGRIRVGAPRYFVGQIITISPCTVQLDTSAIKPNGQPQATKATLVFGTKKSSVINTKITVSSTGEVTVGNIKYPKITLIPVTGGS